MFQNKKHITAMFLDENNNELDLNLNLTGGNMVKVLKGLVLAWYLSTALHSLFYKKLRLRLDQN